MKSRYCVLLFCLLLYTRSGKSAESIEADLLIVGGNESACAAAVQAARLGVKRIVLVNDIEWLGGQFSAEGVGCLDEWTAVKGKRTNFPRSGLFLEVVQQIHEHNRATYGTTNPGNAYCGTETIEPAGAARIFEELVKPYVKAGSLRIERGWQPAKVYIENGGVTGVEFEPTAGGEERLGVTARLTIDASDWGDVIRLSGAKYGAGADLKSRFGEPSAPTAFDDAGAQEMNPLSWCLVLRETGGQDATIQRPDSYDARSFSALDTTPPWVDSDMSSGIYSQSGWSVYTHRRLVDRWHNGFPAGTEATFLNWPVQDYPLCNLPQRVVDALEATEPGASRKNIVHLSPAQRRIIFTDAKQHALGMLYHLQTSVHDRVGDYPQSFRYMRLTDEFGTPDHLPPKPYVREGLRLEALYMMREQDIRASNREPKWAKVLPSDGVFGFQFNIDFHPTRRKFLTSDKNGPWHYQHTATRNWHTDTDRAVFPLRGLVPVEMNGLLGAGKNIGVSSVVQSALRLHGQMMLVGQASATVAWLALKENVEPRATAANSGLVLEVQRQLASGQGGPGVLLWPWHDVAPEEAHFAAANLLAVRGIWQPDKDSLFFEADKVVTRREACRALVCLLRTLPSPKAWPEKSVPQFKDVAAADHDRFAIEALYAWGEWETVRDAFEPDAKMNLASLREWLFALDVPAPEDLGAAGDLPLTRGEFARYLWKIALQREQPVETSADYLKPGVDTDGDSVPDLDDPLPLDRDNNSIPDRVDAPVGKA